MRIKASSYFLIAIMLIMLVVIGLSLRMESLTSELLPLVVGVIVFVLAAIELGKELRSGAVKVESETSTRAGSKRQRRRFLLAIAWVVGFVLASWLLGFMIVIPLFIVAYMKSHGIKWLVAITAAVLMAVFTYSVFELLLKVELYGGLLFT